MKNLSLSTHLAPVDLQGGHADLLGNYHFHSALERGLWLLLGLALIVGTAVALRRILKRR